MRTIFLGLAALLCCATSHAVTTITADAVFTVEFRGGDEGPIIDPPFTGEGSFSLRESRWAAFSFDMFGHHWSLDDMDPAFCPTFQCFPDENGDLEKIQIHFADDAGEGFLSFDFLQGIFFMSVAVGDMGVVGSNDSGEASADFLEFSHRGNVPEPGSLTLLTLVLLGLGWIRRPAHRVGQARRPAFD